MYMYMYMYKGKKGIFFKGNYLRSHSFVNALYLQPDVQWVGSHLFAPFISQVWQLELHA